MTLVGGGRELALARRRRPRTGRNAAPEGGQHDQGEAAAGHVAETLSESGAASPGGASRSTIA
jgi:hypothetical protein